MQEGALEINYTLRNHRSEIKRFNRNFHLSRKIEIILTAQKNIQCERINGCNENRVSK